MQFEYQMPRAFPASSFAGHGTGREEGSPMQTDDDLLERAKKRESQLTRDNEDNSYE